MADTLTNTPIDAEEWKDIYTLSGISSGAQITIQNIGENDLYFTKNHVQPNIDFNKYRIFRRNDIIVFNEGDPVVWIFSPQKNGLVNVEEINNSKLISILIFNFCKIINQNEDILRELKLLNLQILEMGETDFDLNDVN